MRARARRRARRLLPCHPLPRRFARRYDVILFGHLDAFLAVHGVWAMQCLAEIYTALGDGAAAARATAVHAQAVVDFNSVFWDASRQQYSDWIDTAGARRSC